MEKEETDGHVLRRWFSIGDVLSAIVMVTALAASYGNLSARLEVVQRDMTEMKTRDITPGARAELSRMTAHDAAQDQQIAELRVEMRDQRREILESLARLEAKLENHDRGR